MSVRKLSLQEIPSRFLTKNYIIPNFEKGGDCENGDQPIRIRISPLGDLWALGTSNGFTAFCTPDNGDMFKRMTDTKMCLVKDITWNPKCNVRELSVVGLGASGPMIDMTDPFVEDVCRVFADGKRSLGTMALNFESRGNRESHEYARHHYLSTCDVSAMVYLREDYFAFGGGDGVRYRDKKGVAKGVCIDRTHGKSGPGRSDYNYKQGGHHGCLALSPCGGLLAYSHFDHLCFTKTPDVCKTQTRSMQPNVTFMRGCINRIGWSPDGQAFGFATGKHGKEDGIVIICKADGESVLCVGHTGNVCDFAWKPDSTEVASCGDDAIIRIWNMQGECVFTVDMSAHCEPQPLQSALFLTSIDWCPRGKRLAVCGYKHKLHDDNFFFPYIFCVSLET